MAATLRFTNIMANHIGRQATLPTQRMVIPVSRVDEMRAVTIYDPGLGRNKEVTEIRKVNGEILLAEEDLQLMRERLEQA